MSILAIRNLFHDKVRLTVTLTGVVFALILIAVQFGLFLGFLETSANIVDHSGIDLWITAPGLPHVNGGSPIPEKRRYKALAIEGVANVKPFLLSFANWKLPTGARESAQVVGFDVDSGLGGPWSVVEGSVEALKGDDTVLVDVLYKKKLGIDRVGQTVEINGRRARIVGFTSGVRSFTTAPYVYTSFKNALDYMALPADQTTFLAVKLAAAADGSRVKKQLLDVIPGVEVLTNREMLERTRHYWVFRTGAGVTTLMGAVLGLLVGTVVVAQTIYSATVDHIREFGTLKAMGATNGYLYRVILQQALLSAVMGYAIAITIATFIAEGSKTGDALILLPPEVAAGIFVLSLAMCAGASVLSIRKATAIDPAMVFRG